MRARAITVVVGSAHKGRCRYCRRSIVWVTIRTVDGRTRSLPFDRAPIVALPFKDDRGVQYEHWPSDGVHGGANCPANQRVSA